MNELRKKPGMSFQNLWNLNFGFFGVQITYALQNTNISRIFATLSTDPHNLSYFWVLPPLMGIVVQPIIGALSDRTWTRYGRRIPYLFIEAALVVLVMCLLPHSGSFGMTASVTMIFGLVMLMFPDTSINMAMQPFKMLVGDMVNEEQKAKAYPIQSLLYSTSSLVDHLFPFFFALLGIANTAPKGVTPDSVIYSFIMGASILILCINYTISRMREWPPQEYEQYNGGLKSDTEKKENWISLSKHAPSTFWKVGVMQFFSWIAFMYMWTYTCGTVAAGVWGTIDVVNEGAQEAGNRAGVLLTVQAIGSVLWAPLLPKFGSRKTAYALSLALSTIGFAACTVMHDQYLLFIPFLLIGCAWAAILATPFTFVTNALQGYGHMGAYLGLLNGTIYVPQVVVTSIGGTLLNPVGSVQSHMMLVTGISLLLGAAAVLLIEDIETWHWLGSDYCRISC